MASQYNILEYDSELERAQNPQGPPIINQISAAKFLVSLLHSKGILYAFMGGFALVLRGSERPTRDIDTVVEATPRQVWNMVGSEARLIIPNTRLIDGVIKIFLKTGLGNDSCEAQYDVEVDLLFGGTKGSPLDLQAERESLSFFDANTNQQIVFEGLSLRYMIKTKLRACSDRGLERDFEDLKYLLDSYPDDVLAIASDLDSDEVEVFLDSFEPDVREQYQAILGFRQGH